MTPPTKEQIDKLPKWAATWIASLTRANEAARRALDDFENKNADGPFRVTKLISDSPVAGPTFRTIAVKGHSMDVIHEGVQLEVILLPKKITIQWGAGEGRITGKANFVPVAFQRADIESNS